MNADIVILGADVGAGRRQDIRVRLDASSGGTTVAEVADSLNPAGAQVIDATDDWLRTRMPDDGFPSLAAVGERLRSDGIAEMTDATPDIDDTYIGAVVAAVDDSTISGRVNLLGVPLGVEVDHPRVGVGPYKIVIADSDLPSLDDLVARIDAAHRSDRCVAVHCVSRVALALLLAAWDMVGVRVGDRIEHAAVVAADTCAELARRGIVVVTQPGFLPDRGDDFLDDSDRADHDDLYRCGSLIDAGVPVALSSDAPYGPLNPWTVIAGATQRRTASGRRVGTPDERIGVSQAIDRYCTPADDPLRRPRRIAVGEPGELVMADRAWRDVLESPAEVRAAYRVLGGVVYCRSPMGAASPLAGSSVPAQPADGGIPNSRAALSWRTARNQSSPRSRRMTASRAWVYP